MKEETGKFKPCMQLMGIISAIQGLLYLRRQLLLRPQPISLSTVPHLNRPPNLASSIMTPWSVSQHPPMDNMNQGSWASLV
jgi:hypothetical protein